MLDSGSTAAGAAVALTLTGIKTDLLSSNKQLSVALVAGALTTAACMYAARRLPADSKIMKWMKPAAITCAGTAAAVMLYKTGALTSMKKASETALIGVKNVSVAGMNSAKNVSIAAVNGAKKASVATVNGAKNVSVATINGVKNISVTAVNSVKKASITAVNGVKNVSKTAINGVKKTSETGIGFLSTLATKTKNAATTAIQAVEKKIHG